MSDHVYIIAEAGVNHNGSLEMAMDLVDAAAGAGADAVKFQTFSARKLVSRIALKADYQIASTGGAENQLQMLEKLELDPGAHRTIAGRCKTRGIEFLSTAFDEDSLDFLVSDLAMSRIKVPSGEITNAPYLLHAARKGKPILLSTGMSDLADIRTALGVLAFGLSQSGVPPRGTKLAEFAETEYGRAALMRSVSLLHCTSEYPAPLGSVNLRAMDTLSREFGLPVGYSDHTVGITVPIAAAARGAVILEKHLTLDRSLPGPDHLASLQPDEFRAMVNAVREVGESLGTPEKSPTDTEVLNRVAARRSLVATERISRGQRFSSTNMGAKRPGSGLSPTLYWEMLETASEHDYQEDDLLKP